MFSALVYEYTEQGNKCSDIFGAVCVCVRVCVYDCAHIYVRKLKCLPIITENIMTSRVQN